MVRAPIFLSLSLALLGALVSGGCAAPPTFGEARETIIPELSADSSRIYVYRVGAVTRSDDQLEVDGKPVGEMYPNRIIRIDVSPGVHYLSVDRYLHLVGWRRQGEILKFAARAGETYIFEFLVLEETNQVFFPMSGDEVFLTLYPLQYFEGR